jgi:histidinol phosphatase-like enzyme (inositol monophosphatase family)
VADRPDCAREFVDFADHLADLSGDILRTYFRKSYTIETKADRSPVTSADRECETALRALIEAEYPDHGVIGEEHGGVRRRADYVWYLDPIDGTKSFISGVPLFGTLIGLARLEAGGRRPILGVIDQPINGERWIGADGHGATFNGEAVTTRVCAGLDEAALYTTSLEYFTQPSELAAFERLQSKARLTGFGTDCYAYGLVAAGFIDLVMENGLDDHDYCALAPVVVNAGGVFTDWSGKPKLIDDDNTILAAGDARVHVEALALINA